MKRTLQVFNFHPVFNAANDSVDVHIDGDIVDASTQAMFESWFGDETSVSFKSFRNQINATPAKTYNIYINSGGGLVTDAMAMHDFIIDLQNQGKTVNTIGRGIVASAATYILMASKNAEMSKNSWFMVHNVAGGIWGDVNQIERYASTLRQFNDRSRDFYAEYTNMRKEDVSKLMNAETWMTADEAKQKGFIQTVSGEVAFKQKISKDNWQFSDTAILNAYNSAVSTPPAQPDNDKSFFQNQFDDMKKIFTDVINSIKGIKPADNSDKQEILNKVAEAMQPLETLESEIDASITNKVDEALKGDVFKNAIAEAVKPFEQKIAELETEIANSKGKQSTPPADNAPKIIGKFS